MAFTNVDSPTKFIDIAVPCNNKSPQSIGLMWWFLARSVKIYSNIPLLATLLGSFWALAVPELMFIGGRLKSLRKHDCIYC